MFDAYLKIDGIEGESTSAGYEGQIEVTNFEHLLKQPSTVAASTSGGATSGRCEHGDFTITKQVDKASPLIYQKCSDGGHITEITLILCRAAGGASVPFMEFKLTNSIIAKVVPAGDKTDIPKEDVSFNYGKIEWTYTQQKRKDGSGGGKTTGSWNLQTNSAK
jgi:type VI secretion system secreted protein Hcp